MDLTKPIVALFDNDGVILDTESQYTILWNAIGEKYRLDIPQFGQVIKGQTLTHIFQTYFPDSTQQQRIMKELYDYEYQMSYDYIPGVCQFIRDLRAHAVKTVVVTSSDRKKMDQVYRCRPEFKSLFDCILTSEDFTASKPDPFCYLLGARQFETPLENCIVFEDSFNGMKAGKAAGIFTVGVATTNSRERITPCCDFVIDNFEGFSYAQMLHLFDEI